MRLTVGPRTIDGKDCIGLHTTDFDDLDITLWVDSQTNLPVRRETVQSKMGQTIVESFQLDIDTDPARFSLEPPPGYKCKVIEHDK